MSCLSGKYQISELSDTSNALSVSMNVATNNAQNINATNEEIFNYIFLAFVHFYKQTNGTRKQTDKCKETYSVMSDGLSVWQMSLSLLSTNHEMSEIIRKPAAIIMAEIWQKYICIFVKT